MKLELGEIHARESEGDREIVECCALEHQLQGREMMQTIMFGVGVLRVLAAAAAHRRVLFP